MRRLIIGASTLAAALMLTAVPASGQFYVGAYASLPSGDFKDAGANTGFAAEVGVRLFESANEKLNFGVGGAYGMNGTDADALDFTQIMGLGHVVYTLSSGSAEPYLIGSAGYLSLKTEVGDASNTEGGITFGGGIGVGFATRWWIEGKFMTASIEDATIAQIMIGGGVSF